MPKTIDKALLKSLKQETAHTIVTPIQRSVITNCINKSSENPFLSATNTTVFSHEIETGKVTNQKQSGRCWLFATLNIIRHHIAASWDMDDFELSQSYSFFWDKLEKANLFYERMIELADHPLDDRLVTYYLTTPQTDGGWWETSTAVIKKYGVVPKSVMPEAVSTSDTRELNALLNKKLRKDTLVLRDLVAKKTPQRTIQDTKEHMLHEIYRVLSVAIGTPPESFDFSYKDKKKKLHRDVAITPTEFLEKYCRINFDDYVSVVNDPSPNKQYARTYVIDGTSGMVDASPLAFLNVDMATLTALTLKQLKKGECVWFGANTRVYINHKGFMSLDAYDYNGTFLADFSMSKAERLMTRDSCIYHAVVLTGVDVVAGKPMQWKIENSWGEEQGDKGYYTMSTAWMEQNGYVSVIRKDLLSAKLQKALTAAPIHLPPWDPLND